MFTYQIRKRVLKLQKDTKLDFPCGCRILFHLGPPQPFGESADGGRTAVRSKPATAFFNANSGKHTVTSKEPLSPLDARIEEPNRTIEIHGAHLSISQPVASLTELVELMESIYFAFPLSLNLDFGDAPCVYRVDGTVGDIPFRWELAEWNMEFTITTQEHQEESILSAWKRIGLLSTLGSRRLIAALHYFHVAVRLERCGETAGEFVAETILNLSKTLEVLFPPSGDGKNRDAIRRGLDALGFSEDQIERDFMPAVALRNQVDVGHVLLSLLTIQQVSAIHNFTQRAERSFREMLKKVMQRTEAGELKIAPDGDLTRSNDLENTLKRLQTILEGAG